MKKMPEVEDISFQSVSDWFICLNEWPHVTLMCSSWVCTMLCDLFCSHSHKSFLAVIARRPLVKMYLYSIWLLPFCQRVKQKFVKYPQFLVPPWSFSSLSTFWCSLLTWELLQLDGNTHQGQSWRIFCFHSQYVYMN